MDLESLLDHLHERGWIRAREARVTPLTGGVSSEILLIEDGDERFILKRALPKLKVKDDWYADVSRNRYEQEYMRYVGVFLPDAVPRVLRSDPDRGFFIMEHLGDGYANWKALLLAGQAQASHARQAGDILGAIHHRSWNDPQARAAFATTPNFYQLRIEPYLITTGRRHPPLRDRFEAEAQRLAQTGLCLVHGDYSPKNILVGPGRTVVLDCEVAWFGEPAFDLAFLFNHFMLKALFHSDRPDPFLALVPAAWNAYMSRMAGEDTGDLEQRVTRLLLMLMLARVDGKSPVEYLTDESKRNLIRGFVRERLPREPSRVDDVVQAWGRKLRAPAATA